MISIQLSRRVLTLIVGAGRRLLDHTEREFAGLDPLRGNDSRGLGGLPLLPLARVSRGRPVAAARTGRASAACAEIASLPAYQVALWPDGWLLEADGGVRVRDTHEMAEARRWLEMAARNRQGRARAPMSDAEVARTMRMHRLCVPRAVIDLAGRRFASEQVASVALSLVASEWIGERRGELGRAPEQALAARARAWSGSRHAGAPDADAMRQLVKRSLNTASRSNCSRACIIGLAFEATTAMASAAVCAASTWISTSMPVVRCRRCSVSR
jgi:hypothetical protein